MAILQSKNLSIGDIHRLFGYQRQYNDSFTSLLSLEILSEFERQELLQIRTDFDNYIIESKVLEGLVKALTVFPLMRLAGFYRSPIKIALEENIADIVIEDEDTKVTGRLDVLAINKTKLNAAKSFWVLVIESKNSGIDVFEGLPQLLTYAYECLEHQKSVWGLTTNGREYQFVYIQQGNPPIYQLMPSLNLMESERAVELLQVLKAICELG
ncbi:restriction endonuclease subunit R [Plectonema cf. radiosum LEGE 06105]|uniref:Restriction endonuclease subunit R n=1 Tax=Plectonema cf. radiosum LEGE 06105 TaxID=945769 RepID=A0A8J7JT76_9CYAN|nr:restriction endonuclease subunit R [Plectonema radiosum]MBE9211810.1 restriction endonuclease subunit R [Plectonema cf. radiosum LEGE 06105]